MLPYRRAFPEKRGRRPGHCDAPRDSGPYIVRKPELIESHRQLTGSRLPGATGGISWHRHQPGISREQIRKAPLTRAKLRHLTRVMGKPPGIARLHALTQAPPLG